MTTTLRFLGGAGTVTGSKFVLTHGDTRIMVDCGLFQGLKALRQTNWKSLPVEANSIDAVVLTHAHLDHSGYLPRLVRDGFSGRVLCTAATRELTAVILRDSAHLQERDAELANRYGFSRHHPALPLYGQHEAERAIRAIDSVKWHRETTVYRDATVLFRRAGHILGAASAEIRIGGRRVVFSGDLGRYDDPVMLDPEPVPEADYVVIESTYGNRRHEAVDPVQVLGDIVERTVQRGGTVVIPAFAVGRTQSLLYFLWRVRQRKTLKDLRVFLDSPMAASASAVLHRFDAEHKLERQEYEAACGAVQYVDSTEESKRLSADRDPKVIVSASGMATGGRVLHHIAAFAREPQHTLLFSGFQAAGTRGRKLLDGAREVRIHGQWIPVNAEVANLSMLSAHADSEELMRWLGGFRRPPNHVFIVHGEPDASEALRERIGRELGWEASAPLLDEEFEL
jgi:metallo-beta-lactamase family protein